ncbi:MAG: inositol monophosphatase family protein [Pseudomonadota bacterium]
MARSALMNVMIGAATKAGRSLTKNYREIANLQVSRKGPADFVTEADKQAEKIIFEELSTARPGWQFLMEERGDVGGKDKQHRWIVDPLDGTTNFLHSLPMFAVSIALEREGELAAAVIYNPIMEEMFTAEKGRGAYFNDTRMRVAQRKDLADMVIGTGMPFLGKAGHGKALLEMRAVMAETAGVRRYGAAALDLAYVAAGRLDGFWERDLQPWDVAAGLLMVREAGGFATDMDGKRAEPFSGSYIAGNEDVTGKLKKLIDKAHMPKTA